MAAPPPPPGPPPGWAETPSSSNHAPNPGPLVPSQPLANPPAQQASHPATAAAPSAAVKKPTLTNQLEQGAVPAAVTVVTTRFPASLEPASLPPWDFAVLDKKMTDFKVNANSPSSPATKQLYVLLTTGAMNPIHRGHVAVLYAAAAAVTAAGHGTVVAAFASPSNDMYLRGKFGVGNFMPASRRLACAYAALASDDLVRVGAWEAAVPNRWPDFPEVCIELSKAVQAKYPHHSFKVLYCCGEDHYAKCSLRRGVTATIGVCVLGREASSPMCRALNPATSLRQSPPRTAQAPMTCRARKCETHSRFSR
jgi:hypothetical protein